MTDALKKYARFILLTGRFGTDFPVWGSIGLLIFNYFNPHPAFIYAGEPTLIKVMMAPCHHVLIWVAIAYVLAFGTGRILAGPKFASQSVRLWLFERGVDSAPDLPWWDMLRFRPFWLESLLYALSGALFIYIAYLAILHEWSVRPWV